MSKIEKELSSATGVESKRGEDRQDYLARIIAATGRLPDKDWDKLSEDAQEWYNKAADVQNANSDEKKARGARAELKDLPDFPDAEKDDPAPARRGRTTTAGKDDDKAAPSMKVGSQVTLTTKRGKIIKGEVVELDKEVVIVKTDDGDEEVGLDRIESTEVHHGHKATDAGAKDDEPADPVKVGAEVTLTTKRGKVVSGKIVELDDEVVVLSVDGKDEEFSRDRVESIKPNKPAASSRRSSAKDDEPADKKDPPARTRSTNESGVSIGTRIKDLIAEDPERTEEDIAAILRKEKVEFKDNTLKINYSESQRLIEFLRKHKRMK